MVFDTIAIVGVGLIGGSIGMAVRNRGLARRVVGIGRRSGALQQARRLGAIDTGTTQLRRGVADADLTILCTPVHLIAQHALDAASCCPAGSILTDSGSTKREIVARLDGELTDSVNFVGGHPLAGSEKTGIAVARADLFINRVCVITPTEYSSTAAVETVERLWRAIGARVVRMSPDAHDCALAYTSHLPHLAAAALSALLPEEYKEVVATGFRDTTRIAASDPVLWSAIFLQNAEPLLESLRGYERTLRQFRAAIQQRDSRSLQRLWLKAQQKRQELNE